jgi:hypothetical protein
MSNSKCIVILLLISLISLGLFFGLFFGFFYSDTNVPTICTLKNSTIVTNYCCHSSCPSCENLNDKDIQISNSTINSCSQTINDIQQQNPLTFNYQNDQALLCNGGYHCCNQVCDTCPICNTINNVMICSYYDCDCRCVKSVNNLRCRVYCNQCYTVHTIVEYYAYTELIVSNIDYYFSTDLDQATKKLESLESNSRNVCFYNKNNPKIVTDDNSIPPWKIAIMTIFGIVPLFACVCIITGYSCYMCFRK